MCLHHSLDMLQPTCRPAPGAYTQQHTTHCFTWRLCNLPLQIEFFCFGPHTLLHCWCCYGVPYPIFPCLLGPWRLSVGEEPEKVQAGYIIWIYRILHLWGQSLFLAISTNETVMQGPKGVGRHPISCKWMPHRAYLSQAAEWYSSFTRRSYSEYMYQSQTMAFHFYYILSNNL